MRTGARRVVSFEGDLDRLSLDDRIFYDNIRLVTGQDLPYATLMYIWENCVPRNTVIPNLHTSRIRMIVAEERAREARHVAGRGAQPVRGLQARFRRGAGPVSAIGIMTDTDNTGENIHAYYADIVFRRVAPPRTVFASD